MICINTPPKLRQHTIKLRMIDIKYVEIVNKINWIKVAWPTWEINFFRIEFSDEYIIKISCQEHLNKTGNPKYLLEKANSCIYNISRIVYLKCNDVCLLNKMWDLEKLIDCLAVIDSVRLLT